jgi:HEPN domain-containing protein
MDSHDLARTLLDTAKSDLKALRNMTDPESFDERIFGFHAQQTVEKTLKAWLNLLQQPYPYTHDLSLLLHTLEKQGVDVASCWDFLDLSDYAVRFRYESILEDEEALDRESLLKDIEVLVAQIEGLLESL